MSKLFSGLSILYLIAIVFYFDVLSTGQMVVKTKPIKSTRSTNQAKSLKMRRNLKIIATTTPTTTTTAAKILKNPVQQVSDTVIKHLKSVFGDAYRRDFDQGMQIIAHPDKKNTTNLIQDVFKYLGLKKNQKPTKNSTHGEICALPIAPGVCRAYFDRWAFVMGKCVHFVWGGCRGNKNKFETESECLRYCS